MRKTKKIAIIGFGFMGVVHAKNVLASDKLELCGIVESRDGDIFKAIENTGNAGEIDAPIEQLKKTQIYQTLEQCVEIEKPDAVAICVPLFLHYELTKKALNLDLDVFLEKPFCSNITQGQELIALAEEKNKILMVAHCIRFAPEFEFLAECVKDGRYGSLKMLSTNRVTGEPTWGVWQDPKIKKTCGGALLDLIIHDIDFANSCLGNPTDCKVNFHIDEYWEISLAYNDEAPRVSIKGGFLHRNAPFASEYIATFESASIYFSTSNPGSVQIGTVKGAESIQLKGDLYASELDYFADCIENRCPPSRCLPLDSLKSLQVCENIRKQSYDSDNC